MKKFILDNDIYNILKWFLLLFIPSLITALSSLALLLDKDFTLIIGIIGIIATFLGQITKISDNNYYEKGAKNE